MKFITRLIYGLIFAIPLMMVSFALAQASDQYQEENPSQPLECKECHQGDEAYLSYQLERDAHRDHLISPIA